MSNYQKTNVNNKTICAEYRYISAAKNKKPIPDKIVRALISEYNFEVVQQLLKGKTYKVPCRLGYICIVKRRIDFTKNSLKKFLRLDYKVYNTTGEKTYHTNEHSDNCYFQIKWFKGTKTNVKQYKFSRAFHFKEAFKQVLKEGNILFREFVGKEQFIS
jgi:hypothetical protein